MKKNIIQKKKKTTKRINQIDTKPNNISKI